MNLYTIKAKAKKIIGYQYFAVEATDEKSALAKFQAGDREFQDEEFEVVELEKPEIISVEDV